jgi:hypothetical protein
MKNVLIALGFTLIAASAAQAGVLDVQGSPELNRGNAAVNIAQSDYNGRNELTNTGPLNDRSPTYTAPASSGIDYTATASIGDDGQLNASVATQPRLGDGVLPY